MEELDNSTEIIKTYDKSKIVNKIIHISDIHIRTGNINTSRYFEYNNVIKKLINSLKKLIDDKQTTNEESDSIVIITGDIFHNKNLIESYGINLFNELITKLACLTSLYIIRGNHDYRQDYNEHDSEIELISSLLPKNKNIHYLNETGLYEIGDILVGLVAIQDVLKTGASCGHNDKICKFPWTDKEYKHKVALFHGIIVDNPNTIYKEPILIDWVNKYDFGLFGDIHKQHIHNAIWVNDEGTDNETRENINKSNYKREDYYKCNGYYKKDDENSIMWGYSGSLIQQNFGELYNNHGYLIWELNESIVRSIDIPNKHAYCTLYYKNDLWKIKITDNNFKDIFIEFEQFIKQNNITNIDIQIKNGNSHTDILYKILNENNIYISTICNKINNDTINHNTINHNTNSDLNNSNSNNIIDSEVTNEDKPLTSTETWIEFVNKNIDDNNKEHLDKLDWQNVIKNPESLLIDISNLPDSIKEKVEKKNTSISKNIANYLNHLDNKVITNNINLLFIKWDWILCFANNCYYNFENMENNIMLLNAENGFGKSSFLEIISIALFGNSIPSRYNKQFSSSIICNNRPPKTSSTISLLFDVNNKKYLINRTFLYKSADKNKLEQKVELFYVNKYENVENLVMINSGITAVNKWIEINIGNSNTFFQSCMHTQNSDNDLFSMSYNDQRSLMDKSLSLETINIFLNILKDTITNYSRIVDNVGTLYEEELSTLKEVDKDELDRLEKEWQTETNNIQLKETELLEYNIDNNINKKDLDIDTDIIKQKIQQIKTELNTYNIDKLTDNDNDNIHTTNTTKIYELFGKLSNMVNHYKQLFKYHKVDYDKSGWSNIIKDIDTLNIDDVIKDIDGDITTIDTNDISKNDSYKDIKKLSTILKEQIEINNYFNGVKGDNDDNDNDDNDDKFGSECLEYDEASLLRKMNDITSLIKEKEGLKKSHTISIRQNYEKLSKINIPNTEYELEEFIKKIDKKDKLYDKKKGLLDNNNKLHTFLTRYNQNITSLNSKIKYVQEQIKTINSNEYPFNPNCECCKKQPWILQLNDLNKTLINHSNEKKKLKQEYNEKMTEYGIEDCNIDCNDVSIDNDGDDCDGDDGDDIGIEVKLMEDVKQNIQKLEKWITSYKELSKMKKTYEKQLKLYKEKEGLKNDISNFDNILKGLDEEIANKNIEKENIEKELLRLDWISRRNINNIDKQNYDNFIENNIEQSKKIYKYYKFFENVINEYKKYKECEKDYKYWLLVLDTKPKWDDKQIKIKKLENDRKYLQNITTRYINFKKSYTLYIEKKELIKSYKKILSKSNKKINGVKILSEMFNNYRIWIYKEKLFPKILRKVNLIIQNMSKSNEVLRLDIVWTDDVFNWFIEHNGNKVVITKASGYQKFIIDLSMRITLSTIGVSTLKCSCLFIDEGFSSCDADHLNKIPLFLESLKNIYKSILIVSHIDEIKNNISYSYDIKREGNTSYIKYGIDRTDYVKDLIKNKG